MALEDRLRNEAAAHSPAHLVRLRRLVTFDRLLARLLAISPDWWVIKKGGVALDLRRPCHQGSRPREEGQRGDGDPLDLPPDRLLGPDYFAFAGLPPIGVPALPLEQHVAEKLHAYARVYERGRPSSRVKDLVDLVLICAVAAFEARRLRRAIDVTFSTRGTQPPVALPAFPDDWRVPYRRLAEEVDLDPDVAVGHRLAAAFLDPVLSGMLQLSARWEPRRGDWLDAGSGR